MCVGRAVRQILVGYLDRPSSLESVGHENQAAGIDWVEMVLASISSRVKERGRDAGCCDLSSTLGERRSARWRVRLLYLRTWLSWSLKRSSSSLSGKLSLR